MPFVIELQGRSGVYTFWNRNILFSFFIFVTSTFSRFAELFYNWSYKANNLELKGIEILPSPSQSSQMNSKTLSFIIIDILPVPVQVSHLILLDPGCILVPFHVDHLCFLSTSIVFFHPKIASLNVKWIGYNIVVFSSSINSIIFLNILIFLK